MAASNSRSKNSEDAATAACNRSVKTSHTKLNKYFTLVKKALPAATGVLSNHSYTAVSGDAGDTDKRQYMRFGRSQGAEMEDEMGEYLRFGRAGPSRRGDPFLRFGKRGDPFLRFGKRGDPFLRFGKRGDPFLRFGKRGDPFLRFGKRGDPYLRFGRSADHDYLESEKRSDGGNEGNLPDREIRRDVILRFGKRGDPFLRFGKGDPFLRFGKRGDPFLRFGKRGDPFLRFGKGDPFLRFGKRGDPFLRFGKGDPFLRFGKRGDPFLRFGKGDPFLRFGKRGDPFLRFGKGDPFLRFGKKSADDSDETTTDLLSIDGVDSTVDDDSTRKKREISSESENSARLAAEKRQYMRFGRDTSETPVDQQDGDKVVSAEEGPDVTKRGHYMRFGRSPSDLKKEAKRDVYLRFGKSGSSNTDYMGFSKSEAEPDAEL